MLPVFSDLQARVRARRRIRRAGPIPLSLAFSLGLVAVGASLPARAQTGVTVSVTTAHNDNQRTGQNLNEKILTWSNVNSSTFGRLFTRVVDGSIYTQPLYVPNVYFANVPDPTKKTTFSYHNVVYVATEHNTVYAFDADSNQFVNASPLWKASFNYPALGVSPVPSDDIGSDDISPEVGITGTPVVDMATDPKTKTSVGTLYLVVKTKERGAYVQRLHALDLVTGVEKFGGPINIQATVPGTGDGSMLVLDSSGNPIIDPNTGGFETVVPFDPLFENQQAALLLNSGTLYVAFGSHSEIAPYHGWVLAYQVVNNHLQLVNAFNTSPNGSSFGGAPVGAGIWMGGAGPAVDSFGNLYFATGAGTFDVDQGGVDYGESLVKLNFSKTLDPNNPPVPPAPTPPVVDYFTPFDWQDLTNTISDLGSGGVLVLPDGVGPTTNPNLLVAAGVEGTIYLVDRGNKSGNPAMGYFNAGSDSQIVQSLFEAVGPIYGSPAYNNKTLYFQGTGDILQAYTLSAGLLPPGPTATAPAFDKFGFSGRFGFPGSSPSISANGTQNTIIWTVQSFYPDRNVNDPTLTPPIPYPAPIATLHAYRGYVPATDRGSIQALYSGIAMGSRDGGGSAIGYPVPTVANGKVYVAADHTLTVFGLFPSPNTTKGAEPDHFLVTGPVSSAVTFPSIPQRVGEYYQIFAIGPSGHPIKITAPQYPLNPKTGQPDTTQAPIYSVYVYYRDLANGSLHKIGSLTFNNSATAVLPYAFLNSGAYDIYIVDDDSHTSMQPNSDNPIFGISTPLVFVSPTSISGIDHFTVTAPPVVRNGSTALVNIQSVGATGGAAPYSGLVAIYDTTPSGDVTQQVDFNAPGLPYENVGLTARFGKIVGGLMVGTTSTSVRIPLNGLGTHVIVVNGNTATSSTIVNVVP